MRNAAEISRDSAIGIAKWRISELVRDPKLTVIQKFAMNSALADGGAVDQIGTMLYDLGLKLSIDQNNQSHQEWVKSGAVEIEKE